MLFTIANSSGAHGAAPVVVHQQLHPNHPNPEQFYMTFPIQTLKSVAYHSNVFEQSSSVQNPPLIPLNPGWFIGIPLLE